MREELMTLWERWQAGYVAARIGLGLDDELAVVQRALVRRVRTAVTRSRAGTTYLPTGLFARLHPRDAVLLRSFRAVVQAELDAELKALYAGRSDVRFQGCRVTVVPDGTVRRRRPVVEVDWLPVTRVLAPTRPAATAAPSTLAPPELRRAARHRLATGPVRPGADPSC